MVTIGDELTQYQADDADEVAKAAAAVAADKAASDAAAKKGATTRRVAGSLYKVGPTFMQGADGSFRVYQSHDGAAISVIVPKPASTPVPDSDAPPEPTPPQGGTPPDEPAPVPVPDAGTTEAV